MSAINKKTRHRVRLNRSQYKFVDLHPIKTDFYNDDKFAEKMPAVSGAIQNGKMTNEQAIMQLEKTAPLTDAQKQQVNKIELTPTVKETK
jgi:hypothetical protein